LLEVLARLARLDSLLERRVVHRPSHELRHLGPYILADALHGTHGPCVIEGVLNAYTRANDPPLPNAFRPFGYVANAAAALAGGVVGGVPDQLPVQSYSLVLPGHAHETGIGVMVPPPIDA
jgi:hypothetical protein